MFLAYQKLINQLGLRPRVHFLAFFFCVNVNVLTSRVMSQVNLNEDYLKLMGIYPTTGNSRNLAALGGIVSVS
jgi:hypothetical protein